jgi:regulatory protein
MTGGSGWRGGFRRRAPKPPTDPTSGDAARGKAFSLLARRDYPSKLLRSRLGDAGYASDAVDAAMTDLEDLRYVNDERYVDSAVAGRAARGQGPVRIALELVRQGCAKELVESVVRREDPEWTERAVALRHRRFGTDAPSDGKERARQVRFLMQRGFTGSQVRAALAAVGVDEDWEPMDEALDLDADDAAD